jgi:hypothetical protein
VTVRSATTGLPSRHPGRTGKAERGGEDGGEEGEAGAVQLYEALRGHVSAGLSVRREGARVYLQDVSDAGETTVAPMAEAARAISDWQERHLGR